MTSFFWQVDFEVQMDPETLDEWEKVGLEKTFDLQSYIPVSNLVCFDREGRICKYASVHGIIKEFFEIRLVRCSIPPWEMHLQFVADTEYVPSRRKEYYRKRKDFIVNKLSNECCKLKNMVRFVNEVCFTLSSSVFAPHTSQTSPVHSGSQRATSHSEKEEAGFDGWFEEAWVQSISSAK